MVITRRMGVYLTTAGVLVAGLGLAAQQKPAAPAGAKPLVSVYKSPT